MAYAVQDRWIERGSSFFAPMYSLQVIVDALATAADIHTVGRIRADHGDFATVECIQHPRGVLFALFTPAYAVALNANVDRMQMRVVPLQPQGEIGAVVTGYATIIQEIFSAAFIKFFEKHVGGVKAAYGVGGAGWPPVWRFARAIRNALVHDEGRLHFRNAQEAVVWQGLAYGVADNGRQAVGPNADLFFGDVMILMSEMADVVDALP